MNLPEQGKSIHILQHLVKPRLLRWEVGGLRLVNFKHQRVTSLLNRCQSCDQCRSVGEKKPQIRSESHQGFTGGDRQSSKCEQPVVSSQRCHNNFRPYWKAAGAATWKIQPTRPPMMIAAYYEKAPPVNETK